MLPELCPADVGAQATSHASPGCIGRDDGGVLDRPAPGCGLFLQPRSRAAAANQVPNLVEGNEIGHLALHGCNSYVQRACSTAASPERAPRPTTRLTQNPVLGAELVDMAVEALLK